MCCVCLLCNIVEHACVAVIIKQNHLLLSEHNFIANKMLYCSYSKTILVCARNHVKTYDIAAAVDTLICFTIWVIGSQDLWNKYIYES